MCTKKFILFSNCNILNFYCFQFFKSSPLACDPSNLPVIYKEEDERIQKRRKGYAISHVYFYMLSLEHLVNFLISTECMIVFHDIDIGFWKKGKYLQQVMSASQERTKLLNNSREIRNRQKRWFNILHKNLLKQPCYMYWIYMRIRFSFFHNQIDHIHITLELLNGCIPLLSSQRESFLWLIPSSADKDSKFYTLLALTGEERTT